VATTLPSGLKATQRTLPQGWRSGAPTGWPLRVSIRRAVPPPPPSTARVPSGEKATRGNARGQTRPAGSSGKPTDWTLGATARGISHTGTAGWMDATRQSLPLLKATRHSPPCAGNEVSSRPVAASRQATRPALLPNQQPRPSGSRASRWVEATARAGTPARRSLPVSTSRQRRVAAAVASSHSRLS
jgi:hypothetical protein